MQSRLCPVHGCSREEGKEGKRGLKKKGRGAVGLKYRIKESEKAKEKKVPRSGKGGGSGWNAPPGGGEGRMDG